MKKMNKQELIEFLIENFTDEDGDVDLSNLDFGDKNIVLNELKANEIYQGRHQANEIYQGGHKATKIFQSGHKATEICQSGHKADIIYQGCHQAEKIIQDTIKENENE